MRSARTFLNVKIGMSDAWLGGVNETAIEDLTNLLVSGHELRSGTEWPGVRGNPYRRVESGAAGIGTFNSA